MATEQEWLFGVFPDDIVLKSTPSCIFPVDTVLFPEPLFPLPPTFFCESTMKLCLTVCGGKGVSFDEHSLDRISSFQAVPFPHPWLQLVEHNFITFNMKVQGGELQYML